MAAILGFPAQEALSVIDGSLAAELAIHRFDEPSRSKSQLFAVGGPFGKQFAIVLGNTDVSSGYHPAKRTRLLFERCELPNLSGIEECAEPYQGSRIKQQQDSKLAAPNQVSCLVSDEAALLAILRWYAGVPRQAAAGPSLEQTRVAKAAADAGFDLTPEEQGSWTIFRSTAFPTWAGVAVQQSGIYRLGLSDAAIGQRLGVEFGFAQSKESGPLAMRFDGVEGYPRLHGILLRVAAISRVFHQEGLREFVAKTRNPPNRTEAVREVVQRVGQDIFRRTLIEYWGGRCAVTGLDVVEVLRASHIKPWADCESDTERLDVFNGLLLAPHLDALFDRGLVTFSDAGQLLRSPQLSDHQWALLGIDGVEARAASLADGHRRYLRWHRAEVFRGDAARGTGAK
jgi:putative restriction endonuclease